MAPTVRVRSLFGKAPFHKEGSEKGWSIQISARVWNDITFMAAINIIKCDRRPFGVKVIWLMWTANT